MTRYVPKTKPFKHQSRATLRAARQRNHAIFFEPRLGKTKAALDWIGILALKGEVKRVLVLAPRAALDVWETQLPMHFPFAYRAETFDEEWSRKGKPPTVALFLAGREETMRATRLKGKLQRPKQQIIEKWRPDAIIVDESHEYKRPGGRGAQDLWRLVRRLRQTSNHGATKPYVLLLSGTPSAKGWRDLFAQFRIMDDSLLGTNAGDFDEEYCVYGQGARKYTIIRYRNVKRLQRVLDANSSTCTAEQAGLAGRLFFETRKIDLPQRVRGKYVQMVEDFVTDIDGELLTAKNQGVKRLRLQQITSGFTTSGQQIHREKIVALEEYGSLLVHQGESVVVYCRFTAEVDAAADALKRCGFVVDVLDGRTPRGSRAKIVASFQRTRQPHALVAQHQAGSVAIELSRAAEVVFLTLPDGWVTFWQCLNRVRGPNQKRPVRITGIVARGTVDVSVIHNLIRKEDWHGAMMKSPRRYLLGLAV